MNETWMATIANNYNWMSSLITLALITVLTKIGTALAFKVPDIARMREINHQEDQKRLAKDKYPPMIKSSQKVGLACYIGFFGFILPFCITSTAQPLWKIALDIFLILMVYDFFYYLAHRFWFHGNGAMRRVHAVHHQARNPSHIDAHYVHPMETFVGIALYMGTVVLLAALLGTVHIATVVITFLIFVQINTINHVYMDLPHFPFKYLNWAVAKHHVHHIDMHKGNYATITLFYDKLFGTLD